MDLHLPVCAVISGFVNVTKHHSQHVYYAIITRSFVLLLFDMKPIVSFYNKKHKCEDVNKTVCDQ